jgi:phage terminase large subunit-like protein
VTTFPASAHDDQVDAFADAINELALGSRYNAAAWAS